MRANLYSTAMFCSSHGNTNLLRSLGQNQGHDQPVQSEGFREDQDQDHGNVKSWLLAVCSYSGVSHYTNSKTCCQPRKTTRQARRQMGVSVVRAVCRANVLNDDDADDEAVYTQDTCHDDWNDVSHDTIRRKDTHAANADTALCRAVR